MSNRASFLLDASVSSPQLIQLLSSGSTSVLTTVAGGLPKNADDMAVIDLAYRQGSTLATTDHGITNKCRHYQTRAGVCLFGLLILPDGIENQRKILQDIRKGKKRLRFSPLDRGLTWSLIRDYNFLVRAPSQGHPHVLEMCECKVWQE